MNELIARSCGEWGRRVASATLLLGVVLGGPCAPRRAAASELSWQGPAECAASDALRFAVERALGVPLERAARLSFEVRVELSGPQASARLRVKNPDAGASPATAAKERVFVAPDCSKLVDTLAVAVTLAIASLEGSGSELPAAAPAPGPGSSDVAMAGPPATQQPEPLSEAPERDAADDGSLHPSVLFSLVGDDGSLPSPALGASLGFELAGRSASLRALGTLLFEQRVRLASPDGEAAADMGLMFGTLQACANALSTASSLSIPLCAGADAGLLSGSGVSITRPQRATAPWLAPRVDAGLVWDLPFTRLRVGALFTAAAPLTRDEFVVQGIGAVHRARRVVGRAAVGVALRF